MNKFGVLIPTIHFYFPAEDDNSSSSSRKSAFHRILLYAVSQFHGLETSSSVIAPAKEKSVNKKKKQKDHRGNDATKRRGAKQQRQQSDAKGSIKVVTVQGGVLLAPSVKLLDCVIK